MVALLALGALAACGGGGSGADDGGTYSIGGSVSRLSAVGLVLHNNAGDALAVPAGATSFRFAARVARGGTYHVTVATQPGSGPQDSQDCTVVNGSGTANADVDQIAIACGPVGPLTLVAVTPADAASAVPRDARPVLEFSSPLQAASVTGGQVSLQTDAGTTAIAAAVDGARVTLMPASKLLPRTEYRVSATTAVTGRRGEGLASPVIQRFTTADGAWAAVQTLEGLGSPDPLRLASALDNAGHAVVAWPVEGPADQPRPNDLIELRRHDPSTGQWRTTPPMLPGERGQVFGLQIAFDRTGNGMMVWQLVSPRAGPPDLAVWASRFDRASGQWEAASRLSVTPNEYWPVLKVRADGSAAVQWARGEPGGESVWLSVSSTEPDAPWSAPQRVDDSALPGALLSQHTLAVSPTGERMVSAWVSRANQLGTVAVVRARVMDGLPDNQPHGRIVSLDDGLTAMSAQAVIDQDGLAHVAWRKRSSEQTGAPVALWGTRWSDGDWTDPERLSPAADHVHAFHLATNGAGAGVASSWVLYTNQPSGAAANEVRARQLAPAAATEHVLAAGPGVDAQARLLRLVVDPQGHAIAAWTQSEPFGWFASRYCACDGGWSASSTLLGDDMPQVSIGGGPVGDLVGNAVGDALAVWVGLQTNVPDAGSRRVLRVRSFQ